MMFANAVSTTVVEVDFMAMSLPSRAIGAKAVVSERGGFYQAPVAKLFREHVEDRRPALPRNCV